MDDESQRDEIVIRRAQPDEANEIASVYIASRRGAAAYLPTVGTDEEIRAFVVGEMVPRREAWVAAVGGRIVGVMVMDGDEVDQLYLLPTMQRRGIGGRLLNHAKTLRPERLRLWTFQRNTPARRFYEAAGFIAIEFTDGSRNMEREPDVLYEWTSARG